MGLRYFDYENNKELTRQRFGPLDQLSPLRGHRMPNGYPDVDYCIESHSNNRDEAQHRNNPRFYRGKFYGLSHSKVSFARTGKLARVRMFSTLNISLHADDPFSGVSMPKQYYIPDLNESPFRQ